MKQNQNVLALCEGALMVALALALSYVDINVGFQGGSISLVMIPIIVFSLRHGALYGIGVGLVFGTLKFFLAGGVALNWQSMLLDYSVAYAAVGLAGLFKNANFKLASLVATVVGVTGRFIVSFISGVTIYAEYAEPVYLGIQTPNAFIYSIIYNGAYILPSLIIALVAVPVIMEALKRYGIKIIKK